MQLDTRNLTETGSFPQPSAASPGLTDCYQVDIQGVRYKSVNVGEEKNRVSPNRSFGDRFTKKPDRMRHSWKDTCRNSSSCAAARSVQILQRWRRKAPGLTKSVSPDRMRHSWEGTCRNSSSCAAAPLSPRSCPALSLNASRLAFGRSASGTAAAHFFPWI